MASRLMRRPCYWTDQAANSVVKVPKMGTVEAIVSTGQSGPLGVAVDATNVYWTNNTNGTVMKCAVGGCSNAPTTVATGQSGPAGIALDATAIYWANETGGTIMKVAK